VPWHGDSGLVRDNADQNFDIDYSFVVGRATEPQYLEWNGGYITDRELSLKLRNELRMLSEEIKAERKHYPQGV